MDKHTIAHLKTVMDKEQLIDFLADKLETADERSIACVNAFEGIETERFAGKSIGEFLAGEVKLNKAEPKPDGSFGFTFSGLAIQVMAEAFADQFKSSGAVNYLELLFEHSEIGPLTVTMQRVDGLTPAQKLAAVEDQLEASQKERDGLREKANQADTEWQKMADRILAVGKRAEKAEAELSAANEPWRSFVTNDDISALNRFAECCDDPESGGHDLDKDQVERLVSIGALRKTKRNYHETTDFGDFVISAGFTVDGGE